MRRCAGCGRGYEGDRGSRIARGYDAKHVRESNAYRQRIRDGETLTCWRCGEPITNPADCVRGHDDHDRDIVRGPEHVHCNSVEAGRLSQR